MLNLLNLPVPITILACVCYRAPEVSLGSPITEAVDIWGLGCVLTFLFVVGHPFSVRCEYEMVSKPVYVDFIAQFLT